MPFETPDLIALRSAIRADIAARLPGTDPQLRRSLLGILADANAGGFRGLYGYLDFLARQILPDTAETEFLDRWTAVWGVPRKAAAFASGSVTLTGTDSTVIPAGTAIQRKDGFEYTTDADVTVVAGTASPAVTASVAGDDGNAIAATAVALVSPIAGIDTAGVVAAAGIIGGLDAESDDDLRARLLQRIQNPPRGGTADDYVRWALEVAGVTRAWSYPGELGEGTVTVRFVTDDPDNPGALIPTTEKVQEVQDYIDSVRPVTAQPTVVAPVAAPMALTIQLSPNTAAVQAAVTAELQDLLFREAQPGKTMLRSRISEAISIAAGETDHVLVAPAGNVLHAASEIATLGVITWQ